MNILFNLTISAFVAIFFVVSLVNAKPVSQDPDKQLRPTEPNVKQSSDIHLPISHISSNISNSTTDTSANTTIETSTFNNNTTTFVKETYNDTTDYSSSEKSNIFQATAIDNIETVTKSQITENIYLSTISIDNIDDLLSEIFSSSIKPSIVIDPKDLSCPEGYTKDANGECKPKFGSDYGSAVHEVFPIFMPNALIDPKDFTCSDGHTKDTNGECKSEFTDLSNIQ